MSPHPSKPKPKSSIPQYLSWFAKLPMKHRAAIKKAYEQAQKMRDF